MVDLSKKIRVNWHGSWIWADYVQARETKINDSHVEFHDVRREEQNIYILFRQNMVITEGLTKAIINITADSRYKLFINGKFVGRGISRCESMHWYYNQYNIMSFLHPGKNVIAINVRYYGRELAFYVPPEYPGRDKSSAAKGGVLFDVQLNYQSSQGENVQWIGSGPETKYTLNLAENFMAPDKGGLGFLEEFDGRRLSKEWTEIDYDDSQWKSATIYHYPIKTLILDENAPLYEEEVFATELKNIGEVRDATIDLDDEDKAMVDFNILNGLDGTVYPFTTTQIQNADVLLGNSGICEITPPAKGRAVAFTLYFDQEIVGYPRFLVDGPAGTIIDFIVSEKIVNGAIDQDYINTKRGSRVILRGGRQFFEQWDWDGFLGIQVKIRNLTAPLKIYKFCANRTHMRISQHGYFMCNKDELSELWDRCAYTLLCCAIDGYLDCPQREQRSYLGDAYTEALIANVCFGEPRLTKKLIYDAAFGQRHDGLTFCIHPGDYKQQNFVLIDYTLYWIQITWDYYMYYGDEELLIDLYPNFVLAMQWFLNYLDPVTNLLTPNLPFGVFIDWAYSGNKPGINGILNAQFADCLQIIAKIAEKVGDKRIMALYRHQSEVMRQKLDEIFWDPLQHCYRDSSDGFKPFGIISQHTNSYFAIKGVAPPEKWTQIITRVFDQAPLECEKSQINMRRQKGYSFADTPNLNLDTFILYAQPFFMHFVHRFLATMNRFDLILHYFEVGWYPMMHFGKTKTIWETWIPSSSECHAWAATPAYDLSTYWLGVKPLEPGFLKVEISPTFFGLKRVDGVYPTCRGDIGIKWKKQQIPEGWKIDFSIQLPIGIPSGIFRIPPLNGNGIEKIIMNGQPFTQTGHDINITNKDTQFELFYK